jgi:hypothetical protein
MTEVNIKDLKELSPEQRRTIQKISRDNTLHLFTLPGGNICVPLISDEADNSSIPYTHVMNDKVILYTSTHTLTKFNPATYLATPAHYLLQLNMKSYDYYLSVPGEEMQCWRFPGSFTYTQE